MPTKVLLITPPFTQLNTSYPATTYLKGFLDSKGVETHQCDLSIELFNKIFSKDFITLVFSEAKKHHKQFEFPLVYEQREQYILKVERVIQFLQQHEVTAAYQCYNLIFYPKHTEHYM